MKITGDGNTQIAAGGSVTISTTYQAAPQPLKVTRKPFMAPAPVEHFVRRPAELGKLIAALGGKGRRNKKKAADRERPVALTTTLQGGGGFGKTTLAKAACNDPKVKAAYPDGILWVTLGQTPDIAGLLCSQIQCLCGVDPKLKEAAASRELAILLQGRRALLVLDDVWKQSDLALWPQAIKRLITAPNQALAADLGATVIDVTQMQQDEALDLLLCAFAKGQRPDDLAPFRQLGADLGYWPLLLGIVGGQLGLLVNVERYELPGALSEVRARLTTKGLTAFDVRDEDDRTQAVRSSLEASISFLDDLGDRFRELGVFPEDVDLPFAVVERLHTL